MTASLPPAPGDRAGLRAVLLGALANAAAAIRAAPGPASGVVDALDLAAHARWALGDDLAVSAATAAVADAARPRVQNAALAVALMRTPQRALAEGGAAHLYLRLLGRGHPVLDVLVDRAWQWPVVQDAERLPTAALRLDWLMTAAGGDVDPRRHAATVATSVLTARTHPVFSTPNDAQLLARAGWYATDFGADEVAVTGLLPRLAPWVVDGLTWCLAEDRTDLGADLLALAACLRTWPGPPADALWRRLRRLPPSPGTGRLAALLLRYGVGARPARGALPPPPARWLDALLVAERHADHSTWRPTADQVAAVLGDTARDDPWALDAALLGAARRYDVPAVLVLTSLLLDLPVPGSVAVAAVDLLCRAQLPGGTLPSGSTAALASVLARACAPLVLPR